MEDEKTFTAWVTKWALTKGILEVEAKLIDDDAIRINPGCNFVCYEYAHGCGREWHRTPEGAMDKAEDMRKRKIASLRKSIADLEKAEIKFVKLESRKDTPGGN